MKPLRTLGAQIYQRHTGERDEPVSEGGGAEIRNVARIFNVVRQERDDIFRSLAEREAFFRSLTRNAPVGIVHADVLGRIEFVNPAFLELTSCPEPDTLHQPLAGFVAVEDRDKAVSGWRNALTRRSTFRSRLRLLTTKPPGHVWVDALITVSRDITREMRFEQALREEQQRAEAILDVLHEGVLMVDTGGAIRYANDAAGELLEMEDDCTGEDFFEAIRVLDDGEPVTREDFLAGEAMDNRYVTLENRSGRLFDIDLTMLHLRKGEQNERLVFVLRDDSDRRREEERLSWEATHDALTQLLNRRAFMAAMVKALGDADKQPVPSVLIMIDLDYFKPVNDQGGHLVGDDLLKRLADLFKAAVRTSDSVARLGGDEFAILLPACGMYRAKALAETIRTRVEALKVSHDGRAFGVTVSIGLTAVTGADASPRDIIARADEGCYLAKSGGRNRVIAMPDPGAV
jgi:diguanylate cyclase (GGDEF)-like protein/PAS domain S-box-containing protein